MPKASLPAAVISVAAVFVLGAAEAKAQAKPPQCFRSRDWNGWKVTPDAKQIYIRVGTRSLFRMDLVGACPMLRQPGVHLVTRSHGSTPICSALDVDLSVSDGQGLATPCLVKKVSPVSADEAAALPKNLKP